MRCRMTQALIHSATGGRQRSTKAHATVNKRTWKYSILWRSGAKLWVLPAQRWNRPCFAKAVEHRGLARKGYMDTTKLIMPPRGGIGRRKGPAPIRISLLQGDLAWARVMVQGSGSTYLTETLLPCSHHDGRQTLRISC